jgi:hypothetical protein
LQPKVQPDMASKEDLSGTEIDAKMDELDARIDKLRTAYEQYFIGVLKQPPQQQHKDVVRILHELEHKTFIRKTAQKFRLGSLVQKFTSYNTYWNRVLRQIEEGTYKRDLHKVQRREEQRREREQDRQEALELDMDLAGGLDELARELEQMEAAGRFDKPKAPPAPVAPAQPAQPTPEEIRAQKLRELQRKLGIPDSAPIEQPVSRPTPQAPPRPAPYAPGATPQPAAPQPAYGQPAHAIGQQLRGLQSAAFPQVAVQPLTGNYQAPTLDAEAERRNKLEEMKRKLEERAKRAHTIGSASEITGATTPAASHAASTADSAHEGAEIQRLRKLREMKERMAQRSSAPAERAIERPVTRANPAVARPAASASSGEDESVMRVYRNLVEAKKRCNEPIQGLSYESVARSMQEQRERLRQSHGADDVEFKVIIKNGRAFLKPEPK